MSNMTGTGNKPKVLMITARADYGGGPKHVYLLIKYLSDKIDFFAACPNDQPYYKIFTELCGENNLYLIPHRKFSIGRLLGLKKFLHDKKINLIHSHGKGAGAYGRLLSFLTGVKCIHTFHGIHINNYGSIKRTIYPMIERSLSRLTEKIISVSESEKLKLMDLSLAKPGQIEVIYNGVVLPDQTVGEGVLNKPILRIASISRFDYAKNSMLILAVFKELKKLKSSDKIRIDMIGSGPEEINIKKAVEEAELSDKINFTGFCDDPSRYLINSFCYISTSRWEGLPLGVMESMSYGLPVIVTNVIGNNDLIKNGVNGLLYDIDKPGDAAQLIMKLANDASLWKSLSKNARKTISDNYTVDKMAEKTFDLYLRVAQQS